MSMRITTGKLCTLAVIAAALTVGVAGLAQPQPPLVVEVEAVAARVVSEAGARQRLHLCPQRCLRMA